MSRRCTSPALAAPLDDEDLLQEILLRLSPRPSSLLRASLVCKRWRSILIDPRFLCRFRKHHRKPPLLGFFDSDELPGTTIFTPLLDPPDRIPVVLPENLLSFFFCGCRHGIALFLDRRCREAVLWHPITAVRRRVSFPPLHNFIQTAALVCSTGNEQHVYGDCHLSPFKLVLFYLNAEATNAFVCMYESQSDVWGDAIYTTATDNFFLLRPSILVGNALCWLCDGGDILEFDVETQTLGMIEKPADAHVTDSFVGWSFQILRGEDNALGLAVFSSSKQSIQLWERKSNRDGVASWRLQYTVQLDDFFSRHPRLGRAAKLQMMLGYDEETNVLFLSSFSHDFMLQLESMQFSCIGRRVSTTFRMYCPYTHFYTAVRGAAGGNGGTENVNT